MDLKAFMTFADTADAVAASTEMIDSKMGKSLKRFLTKNIIKKELKDKVRPVDFDFVWHHPLFCSNISGNEPEMTDLICDVDLRCIIFFF